MELNSFIKIIKDNDKYEIKFLIKEDDNNIEWKNVYVSKKVSSIEFNSEMIKMRRYINSYFENE